MGWRNFDTTKIYRALIRSKTEYGSIIIRTANPKHLKMIDVPLNTDIRLAIECFKSSLIVSLRNIEKESPPPPMSEELSIVYYTQIEK